jgi:hypothetical protein
MKKLVSALAIACAGTLAFADNAQWNSSWIKGIGDGATVKDLKPTGGTWSGITSDNATVEDGTLTLDLDTDAEAKFTVATASAATAKTAQKLTIKGVFTPCAASDLLTGTKMNETKAQVGFAVVTEDTTSSYYAWVGETTKSSAENGSAIDDWVKLGTCSSTDVATELTVTMNYWAGSASATFAIKNGTTALDLGTAATQSLTSTAATNYKVGEIACTGSGSLTALDGVTGIAVASIASGDTTNYYGTVDAAITAASTITGTKATVKIEADPSGDVDIASGTTVTIDENGKNATINNLGTVEIPLTETQVASGSTSFEISVKGTKPTVTTTDTSKECVVGDITDGKATVTVQTKADILTAVQFAGKAVTKSDTIAKLRTFLTDNKIEAYTKANTSTADIKTALETTGANTLALWQDYALGIKPSDSIAVKPVAKDENTSKITLALATTPVPTGDYTIEYKCGDTTVESLTSIEVPMTTGHYPITITFK